MSLAAPGQCDEAADEEATFCKAELQLYMAELAGFPKSVRNKQAWIKAKRVCTRWLLRLAQREPKLAETGSAESIALGVVRATRGEVRVPKATLVWMIQNKYTRKSMAARLGVSRVTLNKLLKQHQLGGKPSEADVLAWVQAELELHPDHGEVMLWSEVCRKHPEWHTVRSQVRSTHRALRLSHCLRQELQIPQMSNHPHLIFALYPTRLTIPPRRLTAASSQLSCRMWERVTQRWCSRRCWP